MSIRHALAGIGEPRPALWDLNAVVAHRFCNNKLQPLIGGVLFKHSNDTAKPTQA